MNRALWAKALQETKGQLVGSALVMFGFFWLNVWLTSQIQLADMQAILALIPAEWLELLPVPAAQVATSAGRIALAFDHPIVLILVGGWSITRGSDAVSGQLARGTMEWLLAGPVPRWRLLVTDAALTVLGAGALVLSAWLGIGAGLATVPLEDSANLIVFAPAALNLFALSLLLAGLGTLLSACDRYRWRTIGLVVAVFVIQSLGKIVGTMVTELAWLRRLSFVTAYEPQRLVAAALATGANDDGGGCWSLLVQYNAVLLGLALVCYALALIVFCHRDLPAPV